MNAESEDQFDDKFLREANQPLSPELAAFIEALHRLPRTLRISEPDWAELVRRSRALAVLSAGIERVSSHAPEPDFAALAARAALVASHTEPDEKADADYLPENLVTTRKRTSRWKIIPLNRPSLPRIFLHIAAAAAGAVLIWSLAYLMAEHSTVSKDSLGIQAASGRKAGSAVANSVSERGDFHPAATVFGDTPLRDVIPAGMTAGGRSRSFPVWDDRVSDKYTRAQVKPYLLGISVRPVPMAGLKVVKVMPGTPAERAGLKKGDFLLTVNGRKLVLGDMLAVKDYINELNRVGPGGNLKVDYMRGINGNYISKSINVKLGGVEP